MTKKHFIELADWLRMPGMIPASVREAVGLHVNETLQDAITAEVMAVLTRDLARFCKTQNARFDTDRFIGYVRGECGPNGGRVK